MSDFETRIASPGAAHATRLGVVFVLTTLYFTGEVVAGISIPSIALLAGAAHALTGLVSLGSTLLVIQFSARPTSCIRAHGYRRAEILSALSSAVALTAISAFVVYEAYRRVRSPVPVEGGAMLVVSAIGLFVSLVGMLSLRRAASQSLNLRCAYTAVLSDAPISFSIVVAAIAIMVTGAHYVDPILSAAIVLVALWRTLRSLRASVDGLLDDGLFKRSPVDVNVAAVRRVLGTTPGVIGIYDLHVWSLDAGVKAMAAHVVIPDFEDPDDLMSALRERAQQSFGIAHVTLQLEPSSWHEQGARS